MNYITLAVLFKLGFFNEAFHLTFLFSIVFAVGAILLYLWKLTLISIRLFHAFWASIEDED
jgi:hypothetical protein